MIDKWIPGGERESEKLLEKIGAGSVEELFSDIPEGLRPENWDSLPIGRRVPLSEQEVSEIVEELLSRVEAYDPHRVFLGGGAYSSYTPAYVDFILSMGEILTSYTPYQAEISQGLLQALFEYQSLIAELYDMDVVNSSHYDWSTAAAEAALMSLRVVRGRRRIAVAGSINPWRLEVIRSYVEPHDVKIDVIGTDTVDGRIDQELAETAVTGETAAVYVEIPNALGLVDETVKLLADRAHQKGALLIVGMDPVAAAIYAPPGELGADIAVGDGQVLGLGLNYGGPYLGIMATRLDMKLVRQFPGRIIGLTRDSQGRRAYTMILQTREQHIRRAKATSNITTNESLMSILAAAYIAGHGRTGLEKIAHAVRGNTIRLSRILERENLTCASGEHFREIPVRTQCPFEQAASNARRSHGILVGPPLWEPYSHHDTRGLAAVAEYHTGRDLERLAEALAAACRGPVRA